MKITKEIKIKSHLLGFKFGYWRPGDGDDDGEFVKVSGDTQTQAEMAEYLNCSPELIDVVYALFEDLTELLYLDLRDLAMENYKLRQRMDHE